MTKLPDCPRCGDNRLVFEEDDRAFWCHYCKIAFDADPTEGGDYYTDPTKRIERQEAQEAWEAARTAGKGRRGRRIDRGSHHRHSRRG